MQASKKSLSDEYKTSDDVTAQAYKKLEKLRNDKEKIKAWSENIKNLANNLGAAPKQLSKDSSSNKYIGKVSNDSIHAGIDQSTSPKIENINIQTSSLNKKKAEDPAKGVLREFQKKSEQQIEVLLQEKSKIESICEELQNRYNHLILRYEEVAEQKESFKEAFKAKVAEYKKLQEEHDGVQSLLAVGNRAQEELYQTQKEYQLILGRQNIEYARVKQQLDQAESEMKSMQEKLSSLESEVTGKSKKNEEVLRLNEELQSKFEALSKSHQELENEARKMQQQLDIYISLSQSKSMVEKIAKYLENLIIKRNETIREILGDMTSCTEALTMEVAHTRTDLDEVENSIQKFSNTLIYFRKDVIIDEHKRIDESKNLISKLENNIIDDKKKILKQRKELFHCIGRPGSPIEPSSVFQIRNGSILHKYSGRYGKLNKCYCRMISSSFEYTTSNRPSKSIKLEDIVGLDYGYTSNSYIRQFFKGGFSFFLKKSQVEVNEDSEPKYQPWLCFTLRVLENGNNKFIDFVAPSSQSIASWVVAIGQYVSYVHRSHKLFSYNFIKSRTEFIIITVRMKLMYICFSRSLSLEQLFMITIYTCCIRNPQLIRNNSAWKKLKIRQKYIAIKKGLA
ncbi:hypothetical protein cand_036580 [Cryptosporidium andersoni]|uniref:PH domain-containing protein n=1 Tax=Cryptosporidium andersoni TaxID=117008 RepID=A0A1J4MUS8_9CRYT|nr:hypothetical protein cand_036580 [Cryptosporidium andersoni]